MAEDPIRERYARVLHRAHQPWCDCHYPFEHPMSSREVYEALADAVLVESNRLDAEWRAMLAKKKAQGS